MRTLALPDQVGGADPPTVSPSQVFIDAGSSQAARKQRRDTVTAFTTTFIDATGWAQSPLARRLGAPVQVRAFAAWLALATAVPVEAAYVAACGTAWGRHAALVHTDLATSFTRTANQLGYTTQQTRRQWATLAKLVAISGHRPEDLHRNRYDAARHELTTTIAARHGGHAPITLTTPLHGLESTLTVLRILDVPTARTGHASTRAGHWDTLAASAPVLAATMRRYLAQLALSMRPGTVALIDTTLRHLASYLREHHDAVSTVADIHRTHIEGFKAWLNARPGYRGRRDPVKTTIGMRMSHLRCFFDRIIEWGYPDVPARNLVFAGDMPLRDRPLPRGSSTTPPLPRCCPQPAPCHSSSTGSVSRSCPAPGYARESSSDSPPMPSSRSGRATGYAPPSASCAPTATSRCTRGSRRCWRNGRSTAVSNPPS